MKKIWYLFLFVGTCLMSTSSCSFSTTPSNVAEKFAKAMLVHDYATAKQYATMESANLMDEDSPQDKFNATQDSLTALMRQATVQISNEKKNGDSTATVSITTTLPKPVMGIKEKTETILLRKENGQWKVDVINTIQKAIDAEEAGEANGTVADSTNL